MLIKFFSLKVYLAKLNVVGHNIGQNDRLQLTLKTLWLTQSQKQVSR